MISHNLSTVLQKDSTQYFSKLVDHIEFFSIFHYSHCEMCVFPTLQENNLFLTSYFFEQNQNILRCSDNHGQGQDIDLFRPRQTKRSTALRNRRTGGKDIIHNTDRLSLHEFHIRYHEGGSEIPPPGCPAQCSLSRGIPYAMEEVAPDIGLAPGIKQAGEEHGLIQPPCFQPFWIEGNGYDNVRVANPGKRGLLDDMPETGQYRRVAVVFQTMQQEACRLVIADTGTGDAEWRRMDETVLAAMTAARLPRRHHFSAAGAERRPDKVDPLPAVPTQVFTTFPAGVSAAEQTTRGKHQIEKDHHPGFRQLHGVQYPRCRRERSCENSLKSCAFILLFHGVDQLLAL
jgi:hypothetical protein